MREALQAKPGQAMSGLGTLLALAQSQLKYVWVCQSPSESFCHTGDSEGGVSVECSPQGPAPYGSLMLPFTWDLLP